MDDSFWLYTGYAALVLAILIIAWALFFDLVRHRFHPPRRCPKCWYDLSQTDGLTCNECGYTARKERKLHKPRRRWRWAMLAIIPLIAADQLPRLPAIKERGWVAAMPTPLLALSLLWIEPTPEHHIPRLLWTMTQLPPHTWEDDLFAELLQERLPFGFDDDDDVSWFAHEALYAVAWLNDAEMFAARDAWLTVRDMTLATARWRVPRSPTPDWPGGPGLIPTEGISISAHTRPSWPTESPIYARVDSTIILPDEATEINARSRSRGGRDWRLQHPLIHEFLPWEPQAPTGVWTDYLQLVAPSGENGTQYAFDLSARAIEMVHFSGAMRWSDRNIAPTRLDISFERTSSPILEPIDDEPFTQWLTTSLEPTIEWLLPRRVPTPVMSEVYLGLYSFPYPLASRLLERNLTFGFTIEIIVDDEVIGRTEAWYAAYEHSSGRVGLYPSGMKLPVRWTDDALEYLQSDREVRILIRGDENVALRNFAATKYWRGEIEAFAYVSKDVRAIPNE